MEVGCTGFAPVYVMIGARNRCSGKSVLKWLILIALLSAQIVYAGHQLEHDTDELGEPCQICASHEHFENGLSDAACAGSILAAANALADRLKVPEVADRLRLYNARASPLSPDVSF